ncbi:hypothetical protein D6777_02555 [Candidatus Woesearchaeota archaeon]|nr:MAG: hypothetical protein D6777_02555 [Candidatus Woesearchaeota archaeon]
MGKVVCKCGIKREPGYLYFLNKDGNCARVQMARRGQKTSKRQQVMHKCGIEREEGYLYYVDKEGNVCKAKMAKPGSRKRKKKK